LGQCVRFARGSSSGRTDPLPLVDSNHHSRLQRPLSCRWTKGQQSTLSYRCSEGCSIAVLMLAPVNGYSTSSTADTRVTVRVGTAVPGRALVSAAVSANKGTIPKSVDPDPLMPAIDAP